MTRICVEFLLFWMPLRNKRSQDFIMILVISQWGGQRENMKITRQLWASLSPTVDYVDGWHCWALERKPTSITWHSAETLGQTAVCFPWLPAAPLVMINIISPEKKKQNSHPEGSFTLHLPSKSNRHCAPASRKHLAQFKFPNMPRNPIFWNITRITYGLELHLSLSHFACIILNEKLEAGIQADQLICLSVKPCTFLLYDLNIDSFMFLVPGCSCFSLSLWCDINLIRYIRKKQTAWNGLKMESWFDTVH